MDPQGVDRPASDREHLSIDRLTAVTAQARERLEGKATSPGATFIFAQANRGPAFAARAPWPMARAEWRQAKAALTPVDVRRTTRSLTNLRVCPIDGTLYDVDKPRVWGFRYTPHAWGQLWALLGRSHAATRLHDSNWARAVAFQDLALAQSRRGTRDVLFRVVNQRGFGYEGPNPWVIRGVVSSEYATEFDDVAVINYLDTWVGDRSFVASVSSDLERTRAYLTLPEQTPARYSADLSMYVSNSEVGCQSLQARGAIRIAALDTYVRGERQVGLLSDVAAASRRHTLPRENRQSIAELRASGMLTKAFESSTDLLTMWDKACKLVIAPIGCTNAVLVDWLLERVTVPDTFVERLTKTLDTNERLPSLQRGTLSHVVGAVTVTAQTDEEHALATKVLGLVDRFEV